VKGIREDFSCFREVEEAHASVPSMKTPLILICLLALTSCGGGNSSGKSSGHVASPIEASDQRLLETTHKQSVSFVNKKQMTTTYDCNGHYQARGLKNKGRMTKTLEVNFFGKKESWRSRFYNRTNGSELNLKVKNYYRFTVDPNPHRIHVKVEPGVNIIEYSFYRCLQPGFDEKGIPACSLEQLEKEGIFQVDVDYSEEFLAGEDVEYPPTYKCRRSGQENR
jgi:hypothetical protein